MKKFCSNCGKELSEDSKFCFNCGSSTALNNKSKENYSICAVVGCILGLIGFIIACTAGISSNMIYIFTSISLLAGIGGLIDDFQNKRKNKLISILAILLSIGLIIYISTAIQLRNQQEKERQQQIKDFINEYFDD